jgi:hypothetical protein
MLAVLVLLGVIAVMAVMVAVARALIVGAKMRPRRCRICGDTFTIPPDLTAPDDDDLSCCNRCFAEQLRHDVQAYLHDRTGNLDLYRTVQKGLAQHEKRVEARGASTLPTPRG